jgi:hypothetical protein
MPERARHMIRMVAAGLMFLAILMLSAAQVPFEASGHAHHAHAAHHHVVVVAGTGSSSAPCSDHCDHHGQATACCVANCTIASAALPAGLARVSQRSDSVGVYHASALSSLLGAAPDPALRPPERVG